MLHDVGRIKVRPDEVYGFGGHEACDGPGAGNLHLPHALVAGHQACDEPSLSEGGAAVRSDP
jgi:hypothetical protein